MSLLLYLVLSSVCIYLDPFIKCSRATVFWFLRDRNINKLVSVGKVLIYINPRNIDIRTDPRDSWNLIMGTLHNLRTLVFIFPVPASGYVRGGEARASRAW